LVFALQFQRSLRRRRGGRGRKRQKERKNISIAIFFLLFVSFSFLFLFCSAQNIKLSSMNRGGKKKTSEEGFCSKPPPLLDLSNNLYVILGFADIGLSMVWFGSVFFKFFSKPNQTKIKPIERQTKEDRTKICDSVRFASILN